MRAEASEVRARKRVPKEELARMILLVCRDVPLTLREISEILNRRPGTLLNHYLTTLVCNKDIELAYPDRPNHPKQRYRTSAQGRLKLAT
jgi:ATP-dependent DNA helicase RecG